MSISLIWIVGLILVVLSLAAFLMTILTERSFLFVSLIFAALGAIGISLLVVGTRLLLSPLWILGIILVIPIFILLIFMIIFRGYIFS